MGEMLHSFHVIGASLEEVERCLITTFAADERPKSTDWPAVMELFLLPTERGVSVFGEYLEEESDGVERVGDLLSHLDRPVLSVEDFDGDYLDMAITRCGRLLGRLVVGEVGPYGLQPSMFPSDLVEDVLGVGTADFETALRGGLVYDSLRALALLLKLPLSEDAVSVGGSQLQPAKRLNLQQGEPARAVHLRGACPTVKRASIHVMGSTMERVRACASRVVEDGDERLNPFREPMERFNAKWNPREEELKAASAKWKTPAGEPPTLRQWWSELNAAARRKRRAVSLLFVEGGRWTSVFSEYLEQGYSRTREHAAYWFEPRWRAATFFEQAVVSLEYLHDPECGFLDLAVIRSGTIVTSLSRGPGLAEVGLVESALDEEVVREVLGIAGSGGLTPHGSESLGDTCDRLAVYLGIPLLRLTAADVLADAARLHPTEDVYDA